jgi:hypothetical protein
MAKKRKVVKLPAALSPEAYLRNGNARKLPIVKCMVLDNWRVLKKFSVLVARQHVNGNVTFASFLVDLLCTGVKDAFWTVNAPQHDLDYIIDSYKSIGERLVPCDYALAHNIIYEALAYADDNGIAPAKDFALARMVLDEDTDLIPILDIPLGEQGRPLLILNSEDPRNDYYLRQLTKTLGKGNFMVVDELFFDDNDDNDDDDDESELEGWTRED